MPLRGNDDNIIDYLLGRLPEKEAERLDELTITDDAFASRLLDAENDLVDAYVRGELSGEIRERFISFYLSSPKRQDKVRFAETLLTYQRRATLTSTAAAAARAGSPRVQLGGFHEERRRGFFSLIPQWGLATAALLLLLAAAALLTQNRRLHQQITEVESERARLAQNQQELETRLHEQHPADPATATETQQKTSGEASSTALAVGVPAFVLSPAVRGIGTIATIKAPAEAEQIKITLPLEIDDFSRYQVALKDPATNRAVWRSGEIKAEATGESKAVSLVLSTRLLKQQNYTLELSGINDRGVSELISGYPFRFVVK